MRRSKPGIDSVQQVLTERYSSYDRALIRLDELIQSGHTAYLTESEDSRPHILRYITETEEPAQ